MFLNIAKNYWVTLKCSVRDIYFITYGFFRVFDHFFSRLENRRFAKVENLTKSLRQDIFYELVVYDPVGCIGINKL